MIFYLVCTWSAKTAKDFGAKRGSKSARMAKLWQFMQAHTKPAFSEKVQRGDQTKCFKNSLRSRPRLKGPKTHWCKWHYPLICTHLKSKHWRTFWRKQRLQKCPNGQVMAIFARSFTTRIFWKSAKGGPREKIVQKVNLVWIEEKHSCAKVIIPELVCSYGAKTGEDFGAEGGSKRARTAKLWKFLQGHPKPAVSEKVQRGHQGKFF